MPRVRLLTSPEKFFLDVQGGTGFSFEELGKICKVHRRSFSSWKSGKVLMPDHVFETLLKMSGIARPKHETLKEHWSKADSGRTGALRRILLYGPPGTPEGRRKGGLISSKNLMKNPRWGEDRGFVVRKKITKPKNLEKLAECIGIILGDGTIARMQVVVTVHRIDDFDFAAHIQNLFNEVFGFTPSCIDRKRENVIAVTASRIELVEYLLKKGMKIGDKVRQQVGIPPCVLTTKKARGACLRGLFDTDGCFYVDKHRIKEKMYFNCAMNFTNRSLPLLFFFKEELERRGYHPTHNTKWSLFLRREDEINNYFKEIGSSNNKHVKKYKKFFEEKYGGVA